MNTSNLEYVHRDIVWRGWDYYWDIFFLIFVFFNDKIWLKRNRGMPLNVCVTTLLEDAIGLLKSCIELKRTAEEDLELFGSLLSWWSIGLRCELTEGNNTGIVLLWLLHVRKMEQDNILYSFISEKSLFSRGAIITFLAPWYVIFF